MAINRVVLPEILDGLHPDDPGARRSRGDLRLINAMMGNFRWIARQVGRQQQDFRMVEVGAGEGGLCRALAGRFPSAKILGIDLVPKPGNLPGGVEWVQGDFFSELSACSADVLMGTMILHHFSDERLREFGRQLGEFRMVCFCEPWRSELALFWGGLMWPFVGSVTRHDMPASIRAGFLPGELPGLLGLENWSVSESVDWRGSVRLVARKE
jgi:hypothetical protein